METGHSAFVGSIPKDYDAGLGPNIFQDYAAVMALRAAALQPANVLELAAGTGIVSRQLRDSMPGARLVVTDLNPPMLEVATAKFAPGEVEILQANAMELPFEDGAFDLVVCQFGVMFFPDKVVSFREAARVLRPGGHYLFSTWGTQDDNPYAQVANAVLHSHFDGNPPRFMRVPFSYADPVAVRDDLAAAGWREVTHEVVRRTKRIDDPAGFARGLVCGNPTIGEIQQRGGDAEAVIAEVRDALTARFGPAMVMPLVIHVFQCRKAGG
jgi:SAM-dependent methyltransferase